MNIQSIITYLIIAAALGYSLFSLYQVVIRPAVKKENGSCKGQCGGCDAMNFRDEIKALTGKEPE